MQLILASQSASRQAMLRAAGVPFTAEPAHIDETAIKVALDAQRAQPRDIADRLAELKALKISARVPQALVLGSDSIAVLADGTMLDKPASRTEAEAHLRRMAGSRISLISAAVMAHGGAAIWRHVATAKLSVRPLSDSFLDAYLDAEWPAISGCVGCFRIEARGVQLFEAIEGDWFTILGMPLLPVLDYLRLRGVIAA